jgi:hypothetical protein
MKNLVGLIVTATVVLFFSGMANASLEVIGTASYLGNDYNLIYEDDSIYGGLVWLDYTSSPKANWTNQKAWAAGLGADLTVTLDPGYTTDIDWSTGWRLPSAGDSPIDDFNDTTSEMGHLYYVSLGKTAGGPLGDQSPFSELIADLVADAYITETLAMSMPWAGFDLVWNFRFTNGDQAQGADIAEYWALGVHPGDVSAVPVPGAVWLLGSGLLGLIGIRRRRER